MPCIRKQVRIETSKQMTAHQAQACALQAQMWFAVEVITVIERTDCVWWRENLLYDEKWKIWRLGAAHFHVCDCDRFAILCEQIASRLNIVFVFVTDYMIIKIVFFFSLGFESSRKFYLYWIDVQACLKKSMSISWKIV